MPLLAAEHTALAAYVGPRPLATFLATKEPWGLRIAGEVNLSNRAVFIRALRARLAVHRTPALAWRSRPSIRPLPTSPRVAASR